MNNNYKLIILALVLGLGAWYAFHLTSTGSGVSEEPYADFAIKDTANIGKVVISEKDGGLITIVRGDDNLWYIEETGNRAQPYNINLILETAYRIKVKQDVPPKNVENVITQLSIRHRKVQFFEKGASEPFKVWYVGNATNDHMGTFMLLEKDGVKSSLPYITHKPGVYGSLDVRFFSDEYLWRYSGVFNYGVGEIKSIEVTFFNDLKNSYSIDVTDKGKVILKDHNKNIIPVFDSAQVKHYVTHYRDIYYESINRQLTAEQVDSVMASPPVHQFKVTDQKGEHKTVVLWPLPDTDLLFEETPFNEKGYNTDRAWASINGSKELVKIQYHSWDLLLKPLWYYLPIEKK
jgi:hypothetical protein